MTTEWNANTDVIFSEFNKAVLSDAAVRGVRMLHARVRYTGSVWEFVAGTSSAMGGAAIPVWSTDHLEIALPAGVYDNPPVIFCTPAEPTAVPIIKGSGSTNLLALIYFRDASDVAITTESTTMDFNFVALGD